MDRPAFLKRELGIIEIHGDDAREWLQGQITADISEARPGAATYALIVTMQGKILTDLWVLDRDDELWALLPDADPLERVVEHLDRFIVMEDVELDAKRRVGFLVDGDLPLDDGWPVRALSDNGQLRFERPNGATEASELEWELARVQAGVPRWGKDFGDFTLPQEVGLKAAVSFSKGCYVGQEPIVMLEHRGKPPKRLVRARVSGGVEVGAEVATGLSPGRVTSASRSGDETWVLALIPRKALDREVELQIGDQPLRDVQIVERSMGSTDAT